MTPADWGDIASQGITSALLVLFITGLTRQWWVLGREYIAMKEDRNYWRDAAQRGLNLADTALEPRDGRRQT